MLKITSLTSAPLQKHSFTLPSGESVKITFYFSDIQYGWFINELVYDTVTIRGLRIVNSPNMLHQYRNQLPFGLACQTISNREPTQIDDFKSKAAQLWIVTEDETSDFLEYLKNG